MSDAVAPPFSAAPGAEPAGLEHLSPNQRAWRRFKRNRPAMVSGGFLAVLVLTVLLWSLVAPAPGAVGTASETGFEPMFQSRSRFR